MSYATTPNPGHPWSEIGDGVFAVTNNQTTLRTYTFPNADATILTSVDFTDTAVTGKIITGYVSGAGTVAATDTILQAINKLNGNIAGKANAPSGTINEIAYFDSASTIASLHVATYPSLTELSYVKGVTSAIQTQLGGKLNLSGGTMTGGITNSTSINPLTTLAESWIGPSSTAGIYFKGGNVGIGTTSPNYALQINSANTTTEKRIQISDATTGTGLNDGLQLIKGADEQMYIWNYENTDLHFGTNNTDRLTILAGGNVGIGGFTAPTALLQISANVAGDRSTNLRINNIGGGDNTAASIGFTYANVSTVDMSWISAPWNSGGSNGAELAFGTGGNGTNGTERMRITNTGNVGIGTTTPSSPLAVQGINSVAVLGSEMITNQVDHDFSGTPNWTTGSGSWSLVGGKWSHTASATDTVLDNAYVAPDPVAGNTYQITFTAVTTVSDQSGTTQAYFGGSASMCFFGTKVGTLTSYTCLVTAQSTDPLTFTTGADWVGTLDDISVKLVTPSSAVASILNSDGTTGLEIRSGGSNRYNTAIGLDAFKNNINSAYSTAVGNSALLSNTTGAFNSAFGANALVFNTIGENNNAFGMGALTYNTTGSRNVAIGGGLIDTGMWQIPAGALTANTIGSENVGVGLLTLFSNTSGNNNTAVGNGAGMYSSGSNNLFLGYGAGGTNPTLGNNNIVIGYGIDTPSDSVSNTLNIGNLIFATGLDGTERTLSTGNVGIGTTSPLYKLDVGTTYRFGVSPDYAGNGDIATNSVLIGSHAGDFAFFPSIDAGTVGKKIQLAYYNGSVAKSAVEIANTTGGAYGSLLLMKGGGNVGIGTTTTPLAIFDVKTGTDSHFTLFSSTGGFGESGLLVDSANDAGDLAPLYYNATKYVFWTGKVGIGNTSPANGLDIGSTSTGLNARVNATLGSEMAPSLLVSGWTTTDGWSAGGTLTKVAGTGTGTATPSGTFTVTSGTTYKVVITASAVSGTLTYTLGGTSGTTITATTITDYITAGTTAKIIFSGGASTTATITSVSVEALTDTTGDLAIDGNLVARSPAYFSSNISTTGSGTITSAGLLSANGGLTLAANQNLTMSSGTGQISQTFTGTTTVANTITGTGVLTTTGNLLTLTANSATTSTGLMTVNGNGLTTGSLLDLESNGTAALTGQKGLNILLQGTNSNGAQTTYGTYVANNHAGTSSYDYAGYFTATNGGTTSTNVGLYASASGATNNYGLIVASGNVGIGTTTPTANFQVVQGTAGVGTVSTPGNSTTLTGVGTQFTNTFKVGDTLTVAGETVRTINTITSDTVLDTTVAFSATPRSAVAYTLTGGTRFSVLGNGNVGLATQTFTTNNITDSGALTIKSASGNNLTLDSNGGTSIVNIGNTNATTVAIGRSGQTIQLKGLTTAVANGVLYVKDTNGGIEETAASTSAQCLISASAGAAPTWGACGGSGTLQSVYAATSGNTITTTDGRNIALTFADTTTDQSMTLTQQGTADALIFDDTNVGINNAINIKSGGVSKLTINELGALVTAGAISTTVSSANAFTVGVNGIVGPAFNVDTTTNAANLVTNPSFEVNTTGWLAKGTNPVISQSIAQTFIGSDSLLVNNTAASPAIGDGVKYAYNFSAGVTYTLSFYVKLDSTSNNFAVLTSPYNTFAAGYINGSDVDTDCVLTPSQTTRPINSNSWNRYSCNFTPGAVNKSFYIRQTDATTHKYYIDAIQLEAASSPTTYRDNKVTFGGSLISAPGLTSCNNLVTDSAGTVICGSDLVNHISQVVGNGHSVMRALNSLQNGASSPYSRYLSRLATMLHAQEVNRAVDGAVSYNINGVGDFQSVLQNIIPPRNQYLIGANTVPIGPYIAPNFLGVLHYGINDIAQLNPATYGAVNNTGCTTYNASNCNLNDFKEAMRTMIARYQASAVFEDNIGLTCASASTCVSYDTGTWASTATTGYNSGSTVRTLSTAGGGTMNICLPADLNSTGGIVDLGFVAVSGGNGGVHTITLDGVAVNFIGGTTNVLDTRNLVSADNASAAQTVGVVRRIKIPQGNASATSGCNSATQHKITDAITNVTTSTAFDYYQIEATTPAPTLVVNIARQPDYSAYGAGSKIPSDADVIVGNAALADVINEFPNSVMTVDEDTALGKAPDNFSADKLHPSDQGHALIAEAAYKTLVTAPMTVQQGSINTEASSDYITATQYIIQDPNNQPSLYINTTAINPGGLTNLILNPSFEFDTSGWGNNYGSTVLNRVTTQQYTGNSSLNILTTGGQYEGARYFISLTNAQSYTLSFYAKNDSGTFTTLGAGYWNTTPTLVPCTLTSNTVVSTGWTRYSCTFTATNPLPTSGGSGGGIWIGDSTGAGSVKNFYIDGVLLQNTSTLYPYDEAGSINLIGNIVGPVQFMNKADSTTAFQIQNAAGTITQVNIDNTNNVVSLNNGLFTSKIMGPAGATSSNFGAITTSGAFVSNTSMFAEEFNNNRNVTAVVADSATTGDDGIGWFFDSSSGATSPTYSTPTSTVNGVALFSFINTTTPLGYAYFRGTAAATGNNIYLKANLPVAQMKVKPSSLAITEDRRIGFMVPLAASTTNDASPAEGIYFSNENNTTSWVGVVKSATGPVNSTVTCPGTASITQFSTLRIQVESTTTVRFLVDNDASNGVNLLDCGVVTTTAVPSAAMSLGIMYEHTVGATSNLAVDYMRTWQDDSATEGSSNTQEPEPLTVVSAPSAFDGRVALADLMTASDNLEYDPTARLDIQVLYASKAIVTPQVITNGLIVDNVSSIADAVAFNSDMVFFGRPYFNVDTAGFATIAKGQQKVDIVFEREYMEQPIVNASISLNTIDDSSQNASVIQSIFDNNTQYLITNKSTKGFTLVLNKPASENVQFSWVALAVKSAKNFISIPSDDTQPINSSPPPVSVPTSTEPTTGDQSQPNAPVVDNGQHSTNSSPPPTETPPAEVTPPESLPDNSQSPAPVTTPEPTPTE